MPEEKNKPVRLNLGCGRDRLPGYLNLDLDPALADRVVDLEKTPWPFEDNSVDEVLVKEVFEHLRLHVLDFVRECYRVLKPQGVLRMHHPNAYYWRNRLAFLLGRFEAQSAWHPYHVSLVRPSLLVAELRHYGFDVHVEPVGGLPAALLRPLLGEASVDLTHYNVVITARKRSNA